MIDPKRKTWLCNKCGNWWRQGGWRHTSAQCGVCLSTDVEKSLMTKEDMQAFRDLRDEQTRASLREIIGG